MFEGDIEKLQCADIRKEFISYIYDGESISEACGLLRLNPAAVGLTMRDDITFAKSVRDAQAFRVEVLTDKLENISEYESDPIMAGVMSKNIQWLASKRLRAIYGDKMDVTHNHVINIKDAMTAARERIMLDITPNQLITIDSATDVVSVAPEEIDPLS